MRINRLDAVVAYFFLSINSYTNTAEKSFLIPADYVQPGYYCHELLRRRRRPRKKSPIEVTRK